MTSAQQGTAPAAEPDMTTVRKAVGASAIGNATEWFDFAAYSYVVTSTGVNFFPEGSPVRETAGKPLRGTAAAQQFAE